MMPSPLRELVTTGAAVERARAAVILLHGRGASARDVLGIADALDQSDVAYLAPQAPGSSWYPYSFLAPIAQNEPALSHALEMVSATLAETESRGIPRQRLCILGFSQGGCLALEFAARNATRYGGIVGLSAGLIGPKDMHRSYLGSLAGTPVFIGCSDIDPHIPLWRVQETTKVMLDLGARVTERIYPGFGHAVNEDEIAHVRALLSNVS
jgi:phospholipase/carboxylesterase